jgi:hypothetical protein
MKGRPTRKPEPCDTGVEQLTEYRMRPFGFHADEFAYAARLAEVITQDGDDDNQRVALILLVAGIAAIEDADDRQTHAAEIIRHVFADTEVAEEAARQSMLAWEEIPWEKLRTPAEYDYPVSVEQRRRRAGRR